MSSKLSDKDFIEKLNKINPNITPLEKYIGARTKILVKCNICKHEWSASPSNLTNKTPKGCPICGRVKAKNSRTKKHEDFVNEISNVNKHIKILEKYKNALTPIKCLCLIHNEEFYTAPSHLLYNEIGCQKCRSQKISNALIKDSSKFLEEVNAVNPLINVIGNYKGNHRKIDLECKVCKNKWSASPNSILSGSGCPKCNMSRGERYIRNYLDNNKISYISQKTFDGLKGVNNGLLSYDFYIDNLNLLIEYQGEQHKNAIEIFGGEKQLEIQQEHDRRKKLYAKDNNINLLEIWYYEIEKIDDILRDYLNLNPVENTV